MRHGRDRVARHGEARPRTVQARQGRDTDGPAGTALASSNPACAGREERGSWPSSVGRGRAWSVLFIEREGERAPTEETGHRRLHESANNDDRFSNNGERKWGRGRGMGSIVSGAGEVRE
jgi:hypothetical protein